MTTVVRRSQLATIIRAILPPLLARYALPVLKAAAATPQVRVLALALVGLVAAVIAVPAIFLGMIVFLVTHDPAQATIGAVVVALIIAAGVGLFVARLWSRWRWFRDHQMF